MSEEDRTPQGNSAYNQLMDELRAGRLNPGDRLRETELAERLGVSRPPVREAIRQLEADGVVAHIACHCRHHDSDIHRHGLTEDRNLA